MAADVALCLDVDDDELTHRLLARATVEHRTDDTPEVIAKRLELYHQVTAPLLGWFDERGILITIDGTPPIEEVTAHILATLGDRLRGHTRPACRQARMIAIPACRREASAWRPAFPSRLQPLRESCPPTAPRPQPRSPPHRPRARRRGVPPSLLTDSVGDTGGPAQPSHRARVAPALAVQLCRSASSNTTAAL